MEECVFCKIEKKEIPAEIVYEDDCCLAFRDINPQAPVHILIIPRRHIPSILELKEEDCELMGRMYLVANELARKEGIADRGFRVLINCGPEAGQAVFHIHMHLLGGRKLGWPPG